MREHNFELKSVAITPDVLATYDCVLLATDHDRFDYDMITRHSALIVDSRGRYLDPAAHIVKA
jgi:UDP-N-acetyl-D-glucosamine dehydrogenase